MNQRIVLSLALFGALAFPRLHAQTLGGTDPTDLQSDSSANCQDALSGMAETCDQDQNQGAALDQQNQQQDSMRFPGQSMPSLPGATRGRQTITSGTGLENAPLRNPRTGQTQLQEMRPEPPSDFQRFVAATTGQMLPIYGAKLFNRVPTTFSPNDLAPVTQDYVIGPDDVLRVRIWGQISYSDNLRVDRSGDVYLPQVGAIHVAGLPFSALDQQMRRAVGRIYRNFDLSVDVGQIRAMQIYVAGQARRPGAYTVSSLSTLVNALFASGGPSAQGSLRHILVKRNGETVTDFDLYALLVHGDKSKDIRLLPEDVLYIPPAGPQVAIAGTVRTPAIYEVRSNETIGDLIAMAGNLTAMASNTRISLERVQGQELRQAMEFALDASGLAHPLEDGDILRVYPILPAYQKTVTLRGNVANPGRFAWTDGMHLSDLIPDRDSLQSREYWWKRSKLGLPTPGFEAASQPGMPSFQTEGATHGSLAAQVESLSPATSNLPQTASRASRNTSSVSNLANTSDSSNNDYSPEPRRNVVELTTPEINWDYAVIERVDPETLKTSLVPFDLGKLVLQHDASQNLALQPGDVVTIFSQDDIHVPRARQTKYVNLEGEFVHPGVYSVEPGDTLRDLVQRAGGFTPDAYVYGSEFTRESTRILQQQRLDEYVQTVRMEAERGTQALAISGSSSSNGNDVAASKAAADSLVSRLSQIQATGRIVLQFRPDGTKIDQVPALSLENGDKFVVPPMPATVNVVGAVYNQNSFLFHQGGTLERYLTLAGGPNRNADRHHIFVIRADGSVVSRPEQHSMGLWTSSFNSMRLHPGDTIVVPDKTLRPSALRGVMDWTQVFSQLALGAAAIHAF